MIVLSAGCANLTVGFARSAHLHSGGAMPLNFADRTLGLLLGLGDLQYKPVCHGYQNCCQCAECVERATRQPVEPVRQPWEFEAA